MNALVNITPGRLHAQAALGLEEHGGKASCDEHCCCLLGFLVFPGNYAVKIWSYFQGNEWEWQPDHWRPWL